MLTAPRIELYVFAEGMRSMTAKNVLHKELARHLTKWIVRRQSNGMTVTQHTAIAGEHIRMDS